MLENTKIAEERLAKSRKISASQQETTEEILSGVWAMIEEAQGGKNDR